MRFAAVALQPKSKQLYFMRADKWFISNLDDTQRAIVVSDVNRNIIVQGSAGSGKTNLAIHRAKQASLFGGSYAIVIFTRALRRMIASGMRALGLDDQKIIYDWAWDETGFQLNGTVLFRNDNMDILYLVNGDDIRSFQRISGCHDIKAAEESCPGTQVVGLDFGDCVGYDLYCRYKRRWSFFREVSAVDVNLDKCTAISSAVLYTRVPDKLDYLIVDEAQDFSAKKLKEKFLSRVGKTYALFGDSAQMIYRNQGSSMDDIRETCQADPYFLVNNYRLPKSIAKVAQSIPIPAIDLMSRNMKDRGNSDYPNYPKPMVTAYSDRNAEMKGILDKIREEDLDDVAILVPTDEDLKQVYYFLKENGVESQVLFRTGKTAPFRTIDTLDMANNDLPCIMTYHAAKGTEFDNVFVPFANRAMLPDRNAFYVACTRSSHSLFISYSRILTEFMNRVDRNSVEWVDARTKQE